MPINSTTQFMHLPAECRMNIYEKFFESINICVHPRDDWCRKVCLIRSATHRNTALLLVSRQTYHECIALFYRYSLFHIHPTAFHNKVYLQIHTVPMERMSRIVCWYDVAYRIGCRAEQLGVIGGPSRLPALKELRLNYLWDAAHTRCRWGVINRNLD